MQAERGLPVAPTAGAAGKGAYWVKLRVVRHRSLIYGYGALWSVLALWATLAVVGTLVVAGAGLGLLPPLPRMALLGVALTYVLALLALAALSVLLRAGSRLVLVDSLLPGRSWDYVLAEEGLYAPLVVNHLLGGWYFWLHSWQALSLGAIDQGEKTLVLKAGLSYFKLRALGSFDALRGPVVAHLPPRRARPPARRLGLRVAAVIAGISVLALASIGASSSFERLAAGPVGDELCDVCGRPAEWYVVESHDPGSEGQGRHEFCALHVIPYATMHPLMSCQALARAVRAQGLLSALASRAIMPSMISVMIWLTLAVAIISLAVPRWRKVRTLQP